MTNSARSFWGSLCLLCVLQGTGVLAKAQDTTSLEILEPAAGQTVFGPTTIRCAVYSDVPIEHLTFYFDGEEAGRVNQPPWQVAVDAGEENRQHLIRVVARDTSGRVFATERTLPALHIDDHVDLDLQQVYVTVQRGAVRELGLEKEAFELFDDGRPQEIVTFARGEIPFTAVILVDASSSMRGAPLKDALEGARAFVESMKPQDEAQILAVSDRLLKVIDGSRDNSSVEETDGLEAVGGTAIREFLYLGLRAVERRQGRRAVIALSDGDDGVSALTTEDLLEVARQSRALLYWIRPETKGAAPHLSVWRSQGAAQRDLRQLEKAVRESGGSVLVISNMSQARSALLEVLQELRDQYALGYYPTPKHGDGRWREIDVGVDDRLLRVKWRRHYRDW